MSKTAKATAPTKKRTYRKPGMGFQGEVEQEGKNHSGRKILFTIGLKEKKLKLSTIFEHIPVDDFEPCDWLLFFQCCKLMGITVTRDLEIPDPLIVYAFEEAMKGV